MVEGPTHNRIRAMNDSSDLLDLRRDLAARQGRLLLLVGSGTDRLASDLARSWDQPVTSIGQQLAALEPGARPDLSAILTGSVFTDLDALFWSLTFNLEVLTLMRGVARRQPAAFAWPGVVQSGVASYSAPGRRDHYEATLEDALVLRVRPDAYAGETPYTME